MVFIGGFLLSGASVTINQIIEKDLDKVMTRTMARPLANGRGYLFRKQLIFAIACFAAGVLILIVFTNPLTTTAVGSCRCCFTAFVYTPLKQVVGPIAVFVGAIPGALPPLLGWTAATGNISHEALIIFGIQFIWQFPHFWAIAWVADEDYKKAGFKLLPSGGQKDLNTAIQIMIYTMCPYSAWIVAGDFRDYRNCFGYRSDGMWCAVLCADFFADENQAIGKSALKIMFGSFLYLPIVQIAYLLDKL